MCIMSHDSLQPSHCLWMGDGGPVDQIALFVGKWSDSTPTDVIKKCKKWNLIDDDGSPQSAKEQTE